MLISSDGLPKLVSTVAGLSGAAMMTYIPAAIIGAAMCSLLVEPPARAESICIALTEHTRTRVATYVARQYDLAPDLRVEDEGCLLYTSDAADE